MVPPPDSFAAYANRETAVTAACRETSEGILLTVHVQPVAKRTGYAGLHGEALKFRIAAPPVDGAANAALCAYLAGLFNLPKRAVSIETGQAGREKRVLLKGVGLRQVLAALDRSRDA
jgi:uncharacterized protein (TIGR00251 family)